jgi:hypothetical protein
MKIKKKDERCDMDQAVMLAQIEHILRSRTNLGPAAVMGIVGEFQPHVGKVSDNGQNDKAVIKLEKKVANLELANKALRDSKVKPETLKRLEVRNEGLQKTINQFAEEANGQHHDMYRAIAGLKVITKMVDVCSALANDVNETTHKDDDTETICWAIDQLSAVVKIFVSRISEGLEGQREKAKENAQLFHLDEKEAADGKGETDHHRD